MASQIRKNKAKGNAMESEVRKELSDLCNKFNISNYIYRYPAGKNRDQPIDILWDGDIFAGIECKASIEFKWDGKTLSFLVKPIAKYEPQYDIAQVESQHNFLINSKRIGLYCFKVTRPGYKKFYDYIFFKHELMYEAYKNKIVRLNLSGNDIYLFDRNNDNKAFFEWLKYK